MARSGRFNRMVRIEQKVVTKHETLNSDKVDWVPRYEHVPAGVEPLRGQERTAAAQRQAETSTRIVFHYLPGVLATDRVVDEESLEVYEIGEIIDPGTRHRVVELGCTRGLTDG